MFDTATTGILYTEYTDASSAAIGITSQWSFETRSRIPDRPKVLNVPGLGTEYWLERSDPLLNTILPGTGVSIIVNFGDLWAVGPSRTSCRLLPRVFIVGAVTKRKVLKFGNHVDAVGVGFPTTHSKKVLGVEPSALVDRIVPMEEVWPNRESERLLACQSLDSKGRTQVLRERTMARLDRQDAGDAAGFDATEMVRRVAGGDAVAALAESFGLSRHQFARSFQSATGLSPKLYIRIVRFQALLKDLLSTDVAHWPSLSSAHGYYDQAHMINEFRKFAGSPPITFFRLDADDSKARVRGRPCEWPGNPRRN